jgi:hypothetical protein
MLYMFQAVSHPSSGAQNCTHSVWYMSSLLAATASMGELEKLTHAGWLCLKEYINDTQSHERQI